jgi:hypothetical protein
MSVWEINKVAFAEHWRLLQRTIDGHIAARMRLRVKAFAEPIRGNELVLWVVSSHRQRS